MQGILTGYETIVFANRVTIASDHSGFVAWNGAQRSSATPDRKRKVMDTLQNMRVFVRVVEAGSFTGAAQSLNSTTGAMSRAVSELEAHLRTRLMNRSTRRLALTTAGERYLQRC